MPARGLVFVAAISLVGCTYTLSDGDCGRYRDRLEGWAKDKSKKAAADSDAAPRQVIDDKAGGIEFMKTCAGTTVSKGAHGCMEKAGDEAAFFKCLE